MRTLLAPALLLLLACNGGDDDTGDPCTGLSDRCSSEDSTTCLANGVHTCEADADGCLVWSLSETCTDGATCDNSGAEAVCIEPAQCGDDHADPDEVCDGTDLAGATCESLGFVEGTLSCNPDCQGYETIGCAIEAYPIGWCILQYPPSVSVATDESFTAYVRVFAEGLTDLTGANDPSDVLLVELGYGLDGSDPAQGSWTWLSAAPNDGYGPGAPDYSVLNDEYIGDLSIPGAGLYDFASRVSGDGGATWVYCDLDGLDNGYSADQAGAAAVGQ